MKTMTKEEEILDRLKAVAAFTSVIDDLQGISFKSLHGADTGISVSENRGHSAMVRMVGDERVFAPWDIYISIICNDFFDYAIGDCEDLSTWEDFELFYEVANMWIKRIPSNSYYQNTGLKQGMGWYLSMEDEDAELLEYWLGKCYCILKRQYHPLPAHTDRMPSWMLDGLDEIAKTKGFEITRHPYAKKDN